MEPQPQPQPYGIIPTGLPPLTLPSSIPNPTSYIYTLPTTRPFNHIVVFLVPGIELPPLTGAAVYLSLPSAPSSFKFLGAIGVGKESAVFKIGGLFPSTGLGGGVMAEITIGITLESAEEIASKMSALQVTTSTTAIVPVKPVGGGAGGGGEASQEQTVKLAQKIIKNAFNFLASFSGNTANGVEVVPLKAFEEWWRRFEGRVKRDPGFLGREGEGD